MDLITLFFLIVLVFSIVAHEVAHGSAAYSLGDPTAKNAGRLTFNPLKHLDPIGSVLVPLFLVMANSRFLIGWAKPVPVNPYNFNDQRWGSAKVGLAGPAANLSIALFFGLLMRFFGLPPALEHLFGVIVWLNLLLAVFNLVPVPPLDGSHILFSLLPPAARGVEIFLRQYGIFIFIFIIFYGLKPIVWAAAALFALIVGQPPFF